MRVGKQRCSLRLKTAALTFLLALGAVLGPSAQAAKVEIVDAGTLELRQVDGQELVLIGADEFSPEGLVEVALDGETLRAVRIEFNRTARTLTLVGGAKYNTREGQSLSGDDLVIDLNTDALTGEDVFVAQGNLTILGDQLERVPGQLQAQGAYFSPCGGCGQTPTDYAFDAEQLLLYPGDRLVAYGVQVLLADHPVLYLPALVLPLNEPNRQPRLEIEQDEQDGYTALLGLPFAFSDHTLGTTRLAYFENRPARFGAGVDLTSYPPLPFVKKVDARVMLEPRDFKGTEAREGYESDVSVKVNGEVALERAEKPLKYNFQLYKNDIGTSESSDLYGVSTFDLDVSADYPRFDFDLEAYRLFDWDKDKRLSKIEKWPEVTLDPQKISAEIAGGELSADFKFTAGQYTAASNLYSPSAQREGVNITTTRLEEAHKIDYSRPLWDGATLDISNEFTGRYYGTGARTVDLDAEAKVTQRFDFGKMEGDKSRFGVGVGYVRYEGTSPFNFDRLTGRRLSAPVTADLDLQLTDGLNADFSHTHDLLQDDPEKQGATRFGLRLSRQPMNARVDWRQNFYTDTLDNMTFSASFGGGVSGTVREPTPERPLTPEEANLQWRKAQYGALEHVTFSVSGGYRGKGGIQPLKLTASFDSEYRSNNWSVYATHNMQTPELREIGMNATFATTYDQVVNPLTFSTAHNLNLLDGNLRGNFKVLWRGEYEFEEEHSFDLTPRENTKSDGRVELSVGTKGSGRETNWEIGYGGPFDLRRSGWTEPRLTASLTTTKPGERFSVSGTVNMAGLEQKRTELTSLRASGTWNDDWTLGQYTGGYSLAGNLSYARTRRGTYPEDIATDTLRFSPLVAGVRLPEYRGSTLYLTGRLEQTLTWVDGELQEPSELAPVLALTLDRCCWAARAEADLAKKSYRLSIGMPGSGFQPLLDYDEQGLGVPLLDGTVLGGP